MAATSSPFVFPPMETLRPKSPKSPKGIENPLLKSSFLAPAPPAPSLNVVAGHQPHRDEARPIRSLKSAAPTPGPPPKMSLSLNMKLNATAQKTPPKAAPETPQPMSSPSTIFHGTLSEESSIVPVNTSKPQNWVVAYGFTNDREKKVLLSVLQQCGRFVSTKSNSNWIAVQYTDDLCAAHAASKQMVPIGSIICGISRATGQFLQELAVMPANEPINFHEKHVDSLQNEQRGAILGEADILVGCKSSSESHMSNKRHQSVCERFMYWYFGWKITSVSKSHQD